MMGFLSFQCAKIVWRIIYDLEKRWQFTLGVCQAALENGAQFMALHFVNKLKGRKTSKTYFKSFNVEWEN